MRRLVPLMLLGTLVCLGGQGVPDAKVHAELEQPSACQPCHQEDGAARWASYRQQPCSPYCLTCHLPKDMAQHHAIGVPLPRAAGKDLRLTSEGRMACTTCHRLSTPRRDQVRWRAESLYGRLFRRQDSHLTYFLVIRNDRGQLCRACH